jgi:HNH endonuclease
VEVQLAKQVCVGDIAGCIMPTGYLAIRLYGKLHYAHRLAWMHFYGEPPGALIDHVDRNPLNNAVANLRVANPSQSSMNRRLQSNSTTGLKGVSFAKREGKFRALIKRDGRQRFLGYYDCPHEAARCYAHHAHLYHGEFSSHEVHLAGGLSLFKKPGQ